MHLVFRTVSYTIFIALFSTFPIFKYNSIIVNDTQHDYNITVKVTETYTRHEPVTTTLIFRRKLHSQTCPAQSTNVQQLFRCCKRSNVSRSVIVSSVDTYITICRVKTVKND